MTEARILEQDEEVRIRVEAERARLLAKAGLDQRPRHFRRPREIPFTASQRETTTLLFGGLTIRHESPKS